MKVLTIFAYAALMQAQTPTDSQQLLNEVHQLRQDVAAITVTVQRTQILLFRLQLEESAMARATQQVDAARARLNGIAQRRKQQADEVQGLEAELNRTQDAAQQARLPQVIANVKKQIENWGPDEQEAQSKLIDAETQFRSEQAKRDALEAALDKIDKQLEAATARR